MHQMKLRDEVAGAAEGAEEGAERAEARVRSLYTQLTTLVEDPCRGTLYPLGRCLCA